MDIKTLILKLKLINSQIPEFHRQTTAQVSVSALSIAKNRIQLKEGVSGEVYSDAYSKSKGFKQKGKSKSKVTWTYTGQMMADLQFKRAEIKRGVVTSVIGVSTQDYLKYLVKRYGNVLEPNESERKIISQSYRRTYERFLRKSFND